MIHRKKITTVLLVSLLQVNSATAGVYDLTIHSRANCVNNESITWHLGHEYTLWIFATHYVNKGEDPYTGQHVVSSGHIEKTWRSAAVHWNEPAHYPSVNWRVEGHHYMMMGYTAYDIGTTVAYDCSIYDGWWD